jgi:hypothetical protein
VTVDVALDTPVLSTCWCCGKPVPEEELVRLGQHPEVGVCQGCARWLQRRAVARRDDQHLSASGRLRSGVRAMRGTVIERGWHEMPVVGRFLRYVNRYLP